VPSGPTPEPLRQAVRWEAGVVVARRPGVAEAGMAEAGMAEAGMAEAGMAEAGMAEAGVMR